MRAFLRRNAGRIVGCTLGALGGALLAWYMVESPEPVPTVPRVIGWVLFVSLGAFGGYALSEAA